MVGVGGGRVRLVRVDPSLMYIVHVTCSDKECHIIQLYIYNVHTLLCTSTVYFSTLSMCMYMYMYTHILHIPVLIIQMYMYIRVHVDESLDMCRVDSES